MSVPPGPRGTKALLTYAGMFADPIKAYRRIAAHGTIASTRLDRTHRFYMLTDPGHAEHVLARNQDNYVKAFTYRALRVVLGDGLLTTEGDTWRRHRRILQPVFSRRHVEGFTPHMNAAAERMLTRWDALPDGAVVEVNEQLSGLTLDVVSHALFSTDLASGSAPMRDALAWFHDGMIVLASFGFLLTDRTIPRLKAATRGFGGRLEAIGHPIQEVLNARRADSGPPGDDLVGLLMAARDQDGSGLSDAEIRDELTTFMLAGHETTAVALGWTLALLSAHPAVRDRLEEEVDSAPEDVTDLDKLPWARAVVAEAMRLYPPAWTIERDAVADDEIDGVPIPAGSTVATPPFLIHRHRGTWPNPEGFDPRRFLPGATADRHRYAYLPFGGGRRACIGAAFAQLEAVLLLAAITRRYRLDLIEHRLPAPVPRVTLRPGRRLPLRLSPRR